MISSQHENLNDRRPQNSKLANHNSADASEITNRSVTIDNRSNSEDFYIVPELAKCVLGVPEVNYVSHIMGSGQRRPDPRKINAVVKLPPPTDAKALRELLGTTGHLRVYIREFGKIAAPLTDLLKNHLSFQWGREKQTAFATLKKRLISHPVVRNLDETKPFIIVTDASTKGMGAVLMQQFEDGEHPVAY